MLDDLKRWRVVHERLRYWAAERPDDPFVRCGGEWLTFAELDRQSAAVAGALSARGVHQGDRVAVVLPNCEEMIVTIFALARLGAIQVPINIFLKGEFLRYQLEDSQACALIGDRSGIQEANKLRDELTHLRTTVEVRTSDDEPSEGAEWFQDLVHSNEPAPEPTVLASDLLAILYTSGTTGLPKGCMLSHGYYTALSWAWYDDGWFRPGDRIVTAMPLFHIGGQALTLVGALLGGLSVWFEPAFSARSFIDTAREAKATVAYGVGPMAAALLATEPGPGDRDHDLRLGIWMPMSPENQETFAQRFGMPVASEVYGQTECVASVMSRLDEHQRTPGCIGRPVDHIEARIVDEHDNPVPDGEVGELVLRPRVPWIMFSGYWNKPEATVATFRNLWHHTGDAARMGPGGYMTFVDRLKDSMRRRGENISSMELEAAITRHPEVAAAATHGVPSPLGEDDVKVWLVLEPGATITPEGLHAWFASELPYYAVPRYVQLIDELPVNALGRIQKFELKDRPNDDAWDFEDLGLTVTKADRR